MKCLKKCDISKTNYFILTTNGLLQDNIQKMLQHEQLNEKAQKFLQ